MASIQPDEIEKTTGIRPHIGTLHTPYKDIDKDNPYIIDELPLDYSILDEIDYAYPDSGAYYSYSTRGCIRKCSFCAVGESSRNIKNIYLYGNVSTEHGSYMASSRIFC